MKLLNYIQFIWMRYIPSIIWRSQRCQVLVYFDLDKTSLDKIFEIEKMLHEIGIYFDTGAGYGTRHWEWDDSLRGPLQIRFKRKKLIILCIDLGKKVNAGKNKLGICIRHNWALSGVYYFWHSNNACLHVCL